MSNLHILVVDDEAPILHVIATYLAKRGEHCDTAATGEQALVLLEQHDYDIMLADLTMPGIDGIELTRRVKTIRPQTVCILMSGRGSRLDIIAAMKTGVFDFLDKPFFDLAVLAMVIARAATSRRLVRERDALLENLKNQNAKLETSLNRLHTAYGQLRQQESTLAGDLRQSQRVQRKLLPAAFPPVAGYQVFGFFSPCERLGGDYFNAVPLWDGRLGVYLVDVAGHGVSAAMITIIVRELLQPRRLLQSSYEILGSPDKALAFLNQALRDEAFDPPILVTMVYAVMDPKLNTLVVAGAGHPPPLVVTGPGIARPLAVSGPVLGLQQTDAFPTTTVKLNPGDSVLLYTDGVSDARHEGGDEFTPRRLSEALAAQHGKAAVQAGHAIEDSLRLHLDGQAAVDDMSYIVISRVDAAQPVVAPGSPDPLGRSREESVRVVLPATVTPTTPTMSGGITAGWSAATGVIQLSGLATWHVAPAMRWLIGEIEREGTGPIRVELAGCQALDSTMLGIFYQFAEKLVLHRAGERIQGQLRELGIFEHFRFSEAPTPVIDTPLEVAMEVTPAASTDLILSAHEALMETSDENRRRFQDVVDSFSIKAH